MPPADTRHTPRATRPRSFRSLRSAPSWLRQLGIAGFVCLAVAGSPGVASAQAPETAVGYVYDASGRLAAVSDPASDTGVYRWDAVGNLLEIERFDSDSVSVLAFAPSRSPVGGQVNIYGTGFSTTPSENTVEFNGEPASVVSATKTLIVAEVPNGASSGPVAVTTPAGTGTSATPFTVTSEHGPEVEEVDPDVAAPGDTVAINGSDFATSPAANRVTINRSYPELVSASAGQLQVTVPDETGSGEVLVATPGGIDGGPELTGCSARKATPTTRTATSSPLRTAAERSRASDMTC